MKPSTPAKPRIYNCRRCGTEAKAKRTGRMPTLCQECRVHSRSKQYFDRIERHGITVAQYRYLERVQNHRCPGCRVKLTGVRTTIDHDHSCCPGENGCVKCVRGILCQHCNLTIGQAREDTRTLARLSEYLAAGSRG